MPVLSTKAIPSSTSRSDVRGRPVRPCTAARCGGISGSTNAHNWSLISRGGGEDASDDMPPQPPPTLAWIRPATPNPRSTSATSSKRGSSDDGVVGIAEVLQRVLAGGRDVFPHEFLGAVGVLVPHGVEDRPVLVE